MAAARASPSARGSSSSHPTESAWPCRSFQPPSEDAYRGAPLAGLSGLSQRYLCEMAVLVRFARIVLLLVLCAIAVSLVTAIAGPTGPVEKVVLAAMFAGCFALAIGITSAATRLQRHL